MKNTDITLNKQLGTLWDERKQVFENEARKLDHVLADMDGLAQKHGYQNLKDFLSKRNKTFAIIEGRRPTKYRRRNHSDVERVREMVKEGKRTKEISADLGLAPNTISNIKRLLRDHGELDQNDE